MKNLIQKIGAILLSLTVVGSLLAGCGTKAADPADDASTDKGTFRTLEEIKSSGTINIGVFSDKSPFGYVDENGEYQGYDVYFANRIPVTQWAFPLWAVQTPLPPQSPRAIPPCWTG